MSAGRAIHAAKACTRPIRQRILPFRRQATGL